MSLSHADGEWDTARLSRLRDVSVDQVTLADGDVIQYNSVLATWENVTAAVMGAATFLKLDCSNDPLTAALDIAPDTDITCSFGKWKMGYDGTNADFATLSHYDTMAWNTFALGQDASANTYLNGDTILLRLTDGVSYAKLYSSAGDERFHIVGDTAWCIGGTAGSERVFFRESGTDPTLLTMSTPYSNLGFVVEGDITAEDTLTGLSITDGTTTITGGNYTGVGNITGTDVDISAGTGDITTTGIVDFGGATSFELPNTANPTCDASGEIAINTTDKTLELYNGTAQVSFPTIHIAQGTFDMTAQYAVDPDLWLIDLHADSYPHGIYITKIYVDSTVADPTTELNANLNYCDDVAGGAFPGANPTLIKAIDTTTGNFADAAVNTAIATGHTLYITIDADPTDANVQYHVRIHYYIPVA